MKRYYQIIGLLGLVCVTFVAAGCAHTRKNIATPAAPKRMDAKTQALLDRVNAATMAANTFSADFSYTVTSLKQQQLVAGKVVMMKPNFARVTYSYMAHAAFPNLVASDGKLIYTFTPKSFLPNRTFSNEPFDSLLGARQASGLEPGGGRFLISPANAQGRNIHLWDAVPLQAFFDPIQAIESYLYCRDLSELNCEGEKEIEGVTYSVLHHSFKQGNIAGGENSSFEQRLYIGVDGLIHMYVLEFTSLGRPGIQIMRFSNIQTNLPMAKNSFAFMPPGETPASK